MNTFASDENADQSKQTETHRTENANQNSGPLDRRSFIAASGAIVGATLAGLNEAAGETALLEKGFSIPEEFTLPKLPYAYDALDSIIDKETMNIHHTKHHQTYITKLNEAIKANPELVGKSLEDLLKGINQAPEKARTAIRNHGGGHHNHSLFWETMRAPKDNNEPTDKFAEHLKSTFGSFDKFKEAFKKNALDQFGSGWSWLVLNGNKLELMKLPNQDSPLMEGKTPLLGLDVWEHAYYLKYQNRRPDYVDAWWKVVNWDKVGQGMKA